MDEKFYAKNLTVSITGPDGQTRTAIMDVGCEAVVETEIYSAFVGDDSVESMTLEGSDGTVVTIKKQRTPEEPTNLITFRKKITLG